MKCANCGHMLPEDSRFCQYCGADISVAPIPAATVPEHVQTQPETVPVQQPFQNISRLIKQVDKKRLIIAGIAAAILLLIGIGLLISRALTPGQHDGTDIQCPSCGQEVSSESQFCRNCGEPLAKNSTDGETTQPTDGENVTTATSGDTGKTEDTSDTENEDTPTTAPSAATQPSHTHQYAAATCTAPKTCTCGATSGTALGHSFSDATCTAAKECSRCGTTSGSSLGHSYKSAVTAPTCTSQGYTTYTCSTCGSCYQDNYVSAAHSYQNYKCTACGTVDKAHAYEYLMEWVKQNGTVNGRYKEVVYQDDDVRYSVSYSIDYDNVFINRSNTLDGTYGMTALFLIDYYHGTIFGDIELAGTMDPSSFDGVSPVNYSTYTGPADAEEIMAELARTSICTLLDFLEWFLAEYELGITIADLGFTSY